MRYLNKPLMESITADAFLTATPYPWLNPEGMINPTMLARLIEQRPPIEQFTASFGYERKHGQTAHDRYMLEYSASTAIGNAWQDFIDELCSDEYRRFVCRLFNVRNINLSFQWHYTPQGASVSPHVDSRRKLGSQIFYINDNHDWKPEWGGQTLILDDRGEFPRDSNPSLDDFYGCNVATIGENRSLIFEQGLKSWHAVNALECPEGYYRKVFIVRFEKVRPVKQWRKRIIRTLRGEDRAEKTVF